MKTRSAFYLAGFSFLALVFGLILKSWVFLFMSLPPISVLVIGLMGIPPKEVDIEVSRETDSRQVHENDEIEVRTTIKNNGNRLKYLEVLDQLSPRIEVVDGTNHNVLELDSGQEEVLKYTITCPVRGEIEIGPLKMRYRDSLELFSEEYTDEGKMEMSVLPEVEDINKVYIRPKYTRNWLGNIPSSAIGIGTEFYALREYVQGDEMKKINWKATARYMSPVTNEYEGENSGDVIVVVDGSMDSTVGTVGMNTTSASIRAAVSLTSSILGDRNRVGVVVLGDFLNWVYPGFGREQFYKIIDALTKLRQGGLWDINDAKWVITRFFPRRCQIIFVTPLIDPKVVETVMDLCRGEYDVLVISPSPVALEKKTEGIESPIAEKMLNMERRNIIDRLWHYSLVVDWDPNDPLEIALEGVRRYQMRR